MLTLASSAQEPFEFTVTITFDDLAAMFAAPDHVGRITGTVIAPILSPVALTVTDGVFNLFVNNPECVNTREFGYAFAMHASGGRPFYFRAVKTVRDDAGPDVWADSTTLAITIHDGTDARREVLGTGTLRISPNGFRSRTHEFRSQMVPKTSY